MATISPDIRELGGRLAACRREAQLTQEQLAGQARVPLEALARFERGEASLGVSALSRIADVLGVSPGSLLTTAVPQERAMVEPSVLLMGTRTANLNDTDRRVLAKALHAARTFSQMGRLLNVEQLADRFTPAPAPAQNPHNAGYERARQVRALLPERPGALRGVSRLIESRFDILVIDHRFGNAAVFGASCRSGGARVIAISPGLRSETARRFALAHELGHHLMDLEAEGTTVDDHAIEGAGFWMENTPTEKRANAFAAMLLAPEQAVREVLGDPRPEGYGLDLARELVQKARREFGLGFAAMAWHLHNLKYLRSDETVKALLALPEPPLGVSFDDEPEVYDGLRRRLFELKEREGLSAAREEELRGISWS